MGACWRVRRRSSSADDEAAMPVAAHHGHGSRAHPMRSCVQHRSQRPSRAQIRLFFTDVTDSSFESRLVGFRSLAPPRGRPRLGASTNQKMLDKSASNLSQLNKSYGRSSTNSLGGQSIFASLDGTRSTKSTMGTQYNSHKASEPSFRGGEI